MKNKIYPLLFCLIFGMSACTTPAKDAFDKNYVHSVHFWLNNPESTKDREAFESSLSRFLENSKYVKTNYIGIPPKATREVVDDSFTYHLLVTFESAEEQEKYQKEDVHLQFIEESAHLWNKVIVYDSKGVQ